MTLAELALLVDASPKWVLNAAAVLGGSLDYTMGTARWLAVARAIQAGAATPLPRARALAREAIRQYSGGREPVVLTAEPSASVTMMVDVHRVFSEVNVRLSRLRTMHAPKRPGRRARARRDSVRAAREYGLDLTLLAANLRRTPAERIRQLDAMASFHRDAQRRLAR